MHIRRNILRYWWSYLRNDVLDESKLGMIPCGPAMAKLYDKEYKESDVDVEVQIEVKGHYENTENVTFFTEPEMMVASATLKALMINSLMCMLRLQRGFQKMDMNLLDQ